MTLNKITRLGLISIAAVSGASGIIKTERPKPNVIFILLDDFGYTDLGCYNSKYYETPNIDRLAAEGIRFIDAYAACPVSSPTRSSIMTGKYPVNTGITDWIPGRQELYDLKNDISESNDISGTNPSKVKELYNLLKEWRNNTGAKMMDPNPKWNGLK